MSRFLVMDHHNVKVNYFQVREDGTKISLDPSLKRNFATEVEISMWIVPLHHTLTFKLPEQEEQFKITLQMLEAAYGFGRESIRQGFRELMGGRQ